MKTPKMKPVSASAIKKELMRRKKQAEAPKFSIEDFCFKEQIDFIRDTARFKDAVCSRRSGKTVSCAADLHDTTENLEGDVAYITLSRSSAKKIIWRDLVSINKQFNLGGKLDNTELTITKPNGNVIHVTGAKDASEIEKLRGMRFRKVYIDECQSFRPYIKDLIEDVIEPALTDYNGTLCLIGTPGPIPAGFFYEIASNSTWSHHHWTMADNPHIKRLSGREPIDIIDELAQRRGLTIDAPSIQREYFGKWVKDADSLVYHFTPGLNHAHNLPTNMTYIMGIDIGFKDADAIAILGYDSPTNAVYLVEEFVKSKQDITALVGHIERLREKYEPVKIVMDAGALGKKIQEEIRVRHSLPVEAAEKQRKFEFIKLLNDDLRTGKFKAIKGTRFEEDCSLVQYDWSTPGKLAISDTYHTDIGDAVLYAWRECKHFYKPEVKRPKPHIDQYMLELEAKEAEDMENKRLGGQDEFTDVVSWSDLGIGDDYDDNDY
jgi:hypothetical protein